MRIAIVYDRIYPFAIGGGEKRNWEVARRLVRRGHQVELIGMRYWNGERPIEREGVRLVGVCEAMTDFNEKGKRSFRQPLAFAVGLWRYLRSNPFDVVECSNFPYLSALAARLARWRAPALTICWFEARGLSGWWRYQGLAGLAAYPFELLVSRLTKFNTAISVRTKARAEKVLGIAPNRISMIPCGVDRQEFEQWQAVPKVDQIIYVGRLVQHKRVDTLFRAMAEIANETPNLRLKIVGHGDREKSLRQLAKELGIDERIIFIRQLDADDLAAELAASRLFVFPSEQEGFGLVIVEAMAAGTPVIALDAPLSAANTIIEHGIDGMLARNEGAFPQHMKALLSDDGLYQKVRQKGFSKAAAYDWDANVVPALEKHYEQAAIGSTV